MSIENIYIVGSSGHAKVIIELIELNKSYCIAGIIDDFKKSGDQFLGYKIIGNVDYLKELCKKNTNYINVAIAIGESKNRKLIVSKLDSIKNINYPTLVHPNAVVSKRATIQEGTVVLANSIISTNAKIGKHCILNHGCSVDHDSIINNYITICPKVSIAGNVVIGENSIIGLGANIIEKINIGNNNFIGAGACIIKDTHENSLYFGCPAKWVRVLNKDDIFFN